MVALGRDEVGVLTDTGFALRRLARTQADAEGWATGSDPRVVARTAHVSKVGLDPSSDDSEIFGIGIDQIREMDQMALPGGATGAESEDFYDCAADVMALPGGYRSSAGQDDEDDGDVAKALLTIATGRKDTSLHMRFNARSQNGLGQIKGQDDLAEFVENVHDGWKYARGTMHSQFTRALYKAGYDREAIEGYLQQGVLPRLVADTYAGYTYFLTTLAGYASKVSPEEPWKDSVAGNLLRIHTKDLGLIRSTSGTYRELVLRNYTYMRNQGRTSFWSDKLSKRMALVVAQSLYASPPARGHSSPGGAGASGGSSKNFCETCKRVHQGRPCPATPLSAANRAKLAAGLPQRKYERALKHCKEALAADPNRPHEALIEAARAAAQAG